MRKTRIILLVMGVGLGVLFQSYLLSAQMKTKSGSLSQSVPSTQVRVENPKSKYYQIQNKSQIPNPKQILNPNDQIEGGKSIRKEVPSPGKTKEGEPYDYEGPVGPPRSNPYWAFFKAAASLLLIIVLIYLTIFSLKFFWGKRGRLTPHSNLINLWESSYLSPNKSVHLVEVAGKMLVLGSTEKSLSLLSEITDEETIKLIKGNKGEGVNNIQPFKNYLDVFAQRLKIHKAQGEQTGESTPSGERLKSRISNILEEVRGLKSRVKNRKLD